MPITSTCFRGAAAGPPRPPGTGAPRPPPLPPWAGAPGGWACAGGGCAWAAARQTVKANRVADFENFRIHTSGDTPILYGFTSGVKGRESADDHLRPVEIRYTGRGISGKSKGGFS